MTVDPGCQSHKTLKVRFSDWRYERRLEVRRLWVRYWPYAQIRQLDMERMDWKRWYLEAVRGDDE